MRPCVEDAAGSRRTGPHWRAGLLLLATVWAVCCTTPPEPSATDALAAPTAMPATATAVEMPALLDRDGSWIEVDLRRQEVVLHKGGAIVGEYAASSGVSTEGGYATPPGLYRVQMMEKGPIENVPGVFVSDILIFDLRQGLGIHSRPMDVHGNLLDATLGRPSTGGCVRVGDSGSVYEFAGVGMQVWIH
jgi:hypothetical protein